MDFNRRYLRLPFIMIMFFVSMWIILSLMSKGHEKIMYLVNGKDTKIKTHLISEVESFDTKIEKENTILLPLEHMYVYLFLSNGETKIFDPTEVRIKQGDTNCLLNVKTTYVKTKTVKESLYVIILNKNSYKQFMKRYVTTFNNEPSVYKDELIY